MGQILVRANWDQEASVWVATSDDIPLVTEAATIEALLAKLPGLVSDLVDQPSGTDVPFELVAHYASKVSLFSPA